MWVRKAAAVVTDNPRTGSQVLVAAVELNEHTAAVMGAPTPGTTSPSPPSSR